MAGEGMPDERGEEEHEEATERLLLRSQPRMLRVGEADGDVQRQTAGDHGDIGVNIARITNEPGGVGG